MDGQKDYPNRDASEQHAVMLRDGDLVDDEDCGWSVGDRDGGGSDRALLFRPPLHTVEVVHPVSSDSASVGDTATSPRLRPGAFSSATDPSGAPANRHGPVAYDDRSDKGSMSGLIRGDTFGSLGELFEEEERGDVGNRGATKKLSRIRKAKTKGKTMAAAVVFTMVLGGCLHQTDMLRKVATSGADSRTTLRIVATDGRTSAAAAFLVSASAAYADLWEVPPPSRGSLVSSAASDGVVDFPVFWHMERSGGGTVKNVLGQCIGLVGAGNFGAPAVRGKGQVSRYLDLGYCG